MRAGTHHAACTCWGLSSPVCKPAGMPSCTACIPQQPQLQMQLVTSAVCIPPSPACSLIPAWEQRAVQPCHACQLGKPACGSSLAGPGQQRCRGFWGALGSSAPSCRPACSPPFLPTRPSTPIIRPPWTALALAMGRRDWRTARWRLEVHAQHICIPSHCRRREEGRTGSCGLFGLVMQAGQVGVAQGLLDADPPPGVELQHLADQVARERGGAREQLRKVHSLRQALTGESCPASSNRHPARRGCCPGAASAVCNV